MKRVVNRAAQWVCCLSAMTVVLMLQAQPVAAQSSGASWSISKIGGVAQGSAVLPSCLAATGVPACGAFSITSAGTDVWGASDQLTLVNRSWTGDGTFVVRVASVQNTNPWTKAGLMLRDSTSPGAKHAFLLVSPGKGLAFQRRNETGGLSFSTTGPAATAPIWLKLERRGTTITAFTSGDGATWTAAGSTSISFAASVIIGLAVSSHDAAATATATFSNFSLNPVLPAEWTSTDIGGPREGIADFAAGRFIVDASGADIWGTSDQFRFTYQAVTGDMDVVTRVASLTGAQGWAKAGVMIRASLGAAASHASLFVSKGQGVVFQRRLQAGLPSVSTPGPTAAAPGWVKLERRGDVLTALWSADGAAWTVLGSEVIVLPPTFYVGMALTSHDAGTLARAVFDNVTIRRSTTNAPPAVTLTAPVPNALIPAATTVTVTAAASDSDGTVARVEFYAGSTLIGTDNTAPYAISWSGAVAGTYQITAVATDNGGATATSAPGTITIAAANNAPAVALTTPIAGAAFTAPASISLMASASDSDGQVARVDFYGDGLLIGSSTSTPYAAAWSGVVAGPHKVWAEARDNSGAITVSATVTVVVTPPPVTVSPASAAFLRTDSTTLGKWKGAYGAQGYALAADATSYPSYAQVAVSGANDYTWSAASSEAQALQRASSSGAVAACWFTANTLTVDVNLTDGQPHQVAFYLLDFDNLSRSQRVEVLDANTGALLDSRAVSGFQGGRYLAWNLTGHVAIRLTNTNAQNAVVSGIFFDAPSTAPATPPAATPAAFALTFTPSPDDALANDYRVELYAAAPSAVTAVATKSLGKAGAGTADRTVDITSIVTSLAPGNYVAAIVTVATSGEVRSVVSAPFTR